MEADGTVLHVVPNKMISKYTRAVRYEQLSEHYFFSIS